MRSPSKVNRFTGSRAELDVPQELAERSGLKPGDELFAFAPGGGVLLLARELGRRGFFVGALASLSVAEVLGFVCSSIRSGTLVVQGPVARRRIVFRDGQVVAATSTELSERLGPVMWRQGLITLEQLQEAEPKVSATAKLGRVLMDAGVLSAARLYRGMQLQVREILLGTFIESEGEFAFVDEGDNPELSVVRMPDRTRDVVLEGMGRAEEIGPLRQAFDAAGVARRTEPEPAAPTVREQAAVWARLDGKMAVRDVIRTSRLGEYGTLKALSDLAAAGKVVPPPPSLTARAPLPRQQTQRGVTGASALQLYKTALDRIRQVLGAEGRSRLASYVEILPRTQQPLFEGVDLAGSADLERLHANAQKLHAGAMARAVAQEAADGLVSFALFEARNVLSPNHAADLTREVSRILKGK